MPGTNETSPFVVKFLSDADFHFIHRIFVEAFSDYLIQFQLSEQQFRNHISLNAVDLNRSVGCYDGSELIGVTLNGFGNWDGAPTVYDAGTGVIPSHRRRGASEAMFRMMLPVFRDEGYKQCLLEVISANVQAKSLYEKLGFEVTRKLLLLEAESLRPPVPISPHIELKEIGQIDRKTLTTPGEGKPSWQNSIEAIVRSEGMKRLLGAFDQGKCVGYIAFSAGAGRIAQIGIHPEYRRNGIASNMLAMMEADTRPGFKLQVINIDADIKPAVDFFLNRGFGIRLEQFEMLKQL